MKPLFDKVMICNRGEIAVRIIKTLKKMNIKTVAIYSEADTNSMHVREADEAYFVGNAPTTESYLSIKNIISAVRASGVQAVHPGYGFLSENPNFATALKREGVILIGPSAHAISKMGDKIEAKKIAKEAKVSTVPGYIGIIKHLEQAINIARELEYPVIVKAAAGGGGKGMRIVENDTQLSEALQAAQREAMSSFGDGRVFIEKFIQNPRHIEIQVLADQFGNVVCLGERECSIQRQHQKIIEEAPSPFISEETRNIMYNQVSSLAQKVGYYSAGTVEFVVDDQENFFFLEMNTRLQVEHCVTELVTGIDIVEQMVRIAAGEKLSFSQADVKLNGWAMECRIYAEDPNRGFLPSSGRITEYFEPPKKSSIRIDSGFTSGDEVSMFYDAMIAKLCVHCPTREEAVQEMQAALGAFIIRGIAHNITFLEVILQNPKFRSGDINTNFIKNEYPDGSFGASLTSDVTEVFLAAAIHIYLSEQKRAASIGNQLDDQINRIGTRWIVNIEDSSYPVFIKPVENGYNIRNARNRLFVRSKWTLGNKLFIGEVNGRKVNVKIEPIPTGYELSHSGIKAKVFVRSPRIAELESFMTSKEHDKMDEKILTAPLSGIITKINVKKGEEVDSGQELLILSAMKMENIVTSQYKQVVDNILINEGDQVQAGQTLIEFK